MLSRKWAGTRRPIDVRVIYSHDGNWLIEWDGIIFGNHSEYEPTFFFLEAKQVTKPAKYETLVKRVASMSSIFLPAISNHVDSPSDDNKYKSFVNKLKKHMIAYPNYQTVGVLASPRISATLLKQVLGENKVGVVHLSQEQYKSNVNGLTPKRDPQQHDQHRQ